MRASVRDTIAAVSSAPGSARRGVIRISGTQAWALASRLLAAGELVPVARGAARVRFHLLGFPVDGLLLTFRSPASATGEDQAELHLPGSPALLAAALRAVLAAGARAAEPGEFTRRAYENGRIALAEAEAVCNLILASTHEEAAAAVALLAGGTGRAADRVRDRVAGVLALIESGLDFEEGETGEVLAGEWEGELASVRSAVESVRAGCRPARTAAEVHLGGEANAGKSTLFNALLARERVLVSPVPGTTRDVVREALEDGRRRVLLCDGPGRLPAARGLDLAAHSLAERSRGAADLLVEVHDGTLPLDPARVPARAAAVVLTKADLGAAPAPVLPVPVFRVSAATGFGINELRAWILDQGAAPASGVGERTQVALREVEAALSRAVEGCRTGRAAECVAMDLRDALAALDDVRGTTTPEDVLGRIFARFCLGK